MAIYLVQHGSSLSKEIDPEQGLSDQGTADVKRIAEVAKNYRVQVDEIRHSGKKRARQTAELFASALNPRNGVQEMTGLNPLDDVTSIATFLNPRDNLMLVGHLPFMSKLLAYLIVGNVDKPVFKFQNAGIVCVDQDSDSRLWIIKWTLMPYIG